MSATFEDKPNLRNTNVEDKPIFMVNLLKFKEKAKYPDKRETDLTGKEAYAIYGKEVVGHLE